MGMCIIVCVGEREGEREGERVLAAIGKDTQIALNLSEILCFQQLKKERFMSLILS